MIPIHFPLANCSFLSRNLGEFEPQTTDELESIMRLTSRWKLTSHVDLDINRFPLITSPVDRLVIAYGLHVTGWLRPAFVALCMRDEPLTIEEGRRLGIDVIVCINEVRDLIKKFLYPEYVNLCMREESPTLEEYDRLCRVATRNSVHDIFKVHELITKGTLLKSRGGIAGVLEWFFNLGNWSMNIFCSLVHDITCTSILLCLMGRCAWIGICYTLLILSLGFGRQCKAYVHTTPKILTKFGRNGLHDSKHVRMPRVMASPCELSSADLYTPGLEQYN